MLGRCAFRGALALLALVGCGSSAAVVMADDASVDVPPVDVAVPAACGTTGTGRLQVTVALDPTLAPGQADVWLATHCDGDPSTVQVVRWNNSGAQSLANLGPGAWQVYASSFEAPGASSPAVMLRGASTAAVSVTLPATSPVLVRFNSSSAGAGDAGVPLDAGVTSAWRGVAAITDPLQGTLGWLECFASPAGDRTLSVQLLVRSVCAAAACPRLSVVGAEVRTVDGDTPVDLGTVGLSDAGVSVAPGESVMLPGVVTLRGVIPDGTHGVQVAVFGSSGSTGLPSGT